VQNPVWRARGTDITELKRNWGVTGKQRYQAVLGGVAGDVLDRIAQAGVDLATLAAILGYGSILMVQRYVHPTAEHKRQAMARYDEILTGMRPEPRVQ